eukprot:COSAG04_NODE_5051_length_1763_cov_10.366587_3_plen_122_part_00
MTAGVHCAHFELQKLRSSVFVGVAGPGVDPAAGGTAFSSVEGWLMQLSRGRVWNGGSYTNWAGQPEWDEIKVGDVVVRGPPCAAPRRGWAEGLACARRVWCSTSTPAGETETLTIPSLSFF